MVIMKSTHVGQTVRLELPYSEVCMHLHVRINVINATEFIARRLEGAYQTQVADTTDEFHRREPSGFDRAVRSGGRHHDHRGDHHGA